MSTTRGEPLTMPLCFAVLGLLSCMLCVTTHAQLPRQDCKPAIQRALATLTREVARWPRDNKCFSCHNNGDAARTLYVAARLGYSFDAESLSTTAQWLTHPPRWKHNGGEGIFNEKKLASIQFGFALIELESASKGVPRQSLKSAAEIVAGYQDSNGSWQVEPPGNLGSPATYGNVLATVAAMRLLRTADARKFNRPINQATTWLISHPPKTTLDASATLIGLAELGDAQHVELRDHCLDVLRRGQADSGGWGPYVVSAAEPFDSALALLALAIQPASPARDTMIGKGRRYLLETQSEDGLWTETTRPAGAESYAQRISTSSWAALALMITTPAS